MPPCRVEWCTPPPRHASSQVRPYVGRRLTVEVPTDLVYISNTITRTLLRGCPYPPHKAENGGPFCARVWPLFSQTFSVAMFVAAMALAFPCEIVVFSKLHTPALLGPCAPRYKLCRPSHVLLWQVPPVAHLASYWSECTRYVTFSIASLRALPRP